MWRNGGSDWWNTDPCYSTKKHPVTLLTVLPVTSLCLLHKASTVDHYAHRRVSVKAGFLPSTDFSFLRHLIFFFKPWIKLVFITPVIPGQAQQRRGEHDWDGGAAEGGTGPSQRALLPCPLRPTAPCPVSSTWGAQPSPVLGWVFPSFHPNAAAYKVPADTLQKRPNLLK